jgi:hypothetical protein
MKKVTAADVKRAWKRKERARLQEEIEKLREKQRRSEVTKTSETALTHS